MERAIFINPMGISNFHFGGARFMHGWTDGEFVYSLDKSNKWRQDDVDAAWMEGRNLEPLDGRD